VAKLNNTTKEKQSTKSTSISQALANYTMSQH